MCLAVIIARMLWCRGLLLNHAWHSDDLLHHRSSKETWSRSTEHSCRMWLIQLFAFVISQESFPLDICLILWSLWVFYVWKHVNTIFESRSWVGGWDCYNGCLTLKPCAQRLDETLTIVPPVAAVLFPGELFHGSRTPFILTSVNPVSLSPHTVSSWAAPLCFPLFFSLSLSFFIM